MANAGNEVRARMFIASSRELLDALPTDFFTAAQAEQLLRRKLPGFSSMSSGSIRAKFTQMTAAGILYRVGYFGRGRNLVLSKLPGQSMDDVPEEVFSFAKAPDMVTKEELSRWDRIFSSRTMRAMDALAQVYQGGKLVPLPEKLPQRFNARVIKGV